MFKAVIDTVIGNLQLSISNVHIRCEGVICVSAWRLVVHAVCTMDPGCPCRPLCQKLQLATSLCVAVICKLEGLPSWARAFVTHLPHSPCPPRCAPMPWTLYCQV